MVRTQIYLTKSIYQGIKALAQKEGVPASKITRRLLEQGLEKEFVKNGANKLLEMANHSMESGIKNLSSDIDKYLYE